MYLYGQSGSVETQIHVKVSLELFQNTAESGGLKNVTFYWIPEHSRVSRMNMLLKKHHQQTHKTGHSVGFSRGWLSHHHLDSKKRGGGEISQI